MRLLVLGGTRFVGRHLVAAALAAGHETTLFNRGASAPALFPGVETLRGDRGGDHAVLAGRSWDAVVDVSAYRPGEVRRAAARLRGRVGRYVLVSTLSVYARFEDGGDEDASTHAALEDGAAEPPGSYGPLKRACELVVEREWGGPWTVARPCVVAGPHDPTDRFTYWPVRIARGGRVLVPGAAGAFAQCVDARDLAAWLLVAAAGGAEGTFNVVGPALPFREFLAACAPEGSRAELVPAGDDVLVANGVRPYVDLPLWIPGRAAPFSSAKAAAAGFRPRPVAETAADVLRWHRERGSPAMLAAGLDPEREKALIAAAGA